MSEFAIEAGVPIPKGTRFRRARYPFADMNVGDSFFVPASNGDLRKKQVRLTATAAYYKHRDGSEFTCRTIDGGIRVWRTA